MTQVPHWRVLASRTVIDDQWLRVHAERVRTADGHELDPFYVVHEHHWACALPLLPDGRLVMIEQYRHGAQRVSLEFPAGDIDSGEDPAMAAVRELAEETGYIAVAPPRFISRVFPEPARNRSLAHSYVVTVAAEAAAARPDPAEGIVVRLVSVAEAMAAIVDGRFCHGTQIGFFLLARERGLLGA